MMGIRRTSDFHLVSIGVVLELVVLQAPFNASLLDLE